MIIPKDTGGNYRIDKFVDYQHMVPPIYQGVLSEYSIRKKLSPDDVILLSWYMSVTYSEITAIWLFEKLKIEDLKDTTKFFEEYNSKMIFGSSKKYNRYCNRFVNLNASFYEQYGCELSKKLYEIIGSNSEKIRYDNVLAYNLKIKDCGRFSAELFNECMLFLSESGLIEAKMSSPNSIDWNKGANLTSCMFNLIYKDELADEYDSLGKLTPEMKEYIPLFNEKLLIIKDKIWDKYPNRKVDIPLFTPKLCSFRNLFKRTRYGGFHHDRQLEHIKFYEKVLPKDNEIWGSLYTIRKDIFAHNLLGELNNWDGIRKERKRLWVDYGYTGVEAESINLKASLEDLF